MNISPAGLEEVFQDYWIGENGIYGIGDLFLTEEEWDERDVEQLIRQKTKNQLCKILIKTCRGRTLRYETGVRKRSVTGALVTPGKRKFSPQPEPHCDGNPTKAAWQDLESTLDQIASAVMRAA